jgi:RND family efflux transporter MFP subunit
MSADKKWVQIAVPLVVLLIGLLGMGALVFSRPAPHKEVRENPGALVDTLIVARGDQHVLVYGTGTVQSRQQVEITPQVNGRIIEIAPALVVGGFFRAGEVLFRIEDADYRLAVDMARAALAKAEFDLATVEGQARVARQEWDRLDLAGGKDNPNPLVLQEPQLKNAQASLLAARATQQQAELDLARTVVRAPFAGVIRSKSVDLGQVVRAGTAAAVLAGTGQAEIIVPLPLHELGWLQIPRHGDKSSGSPATVRLTTGNRTYEWSGRIVRSLGEVDPQGRMARVVVAVDDPYGLQNRGNRPELAVGTFVQVVLQGEVLPDVAVIPAIALRDGPQVWVMNDGRLSVRDVEVVRRAREEVIIGGGLAAGERVVLTNVPGAAEGMKLRSTGAGSPGAED